MDAKTREFKPTHRLRHRGETVDVMRVRNLAYLREDWEAGTVTDFEYDRDDGWLFQGLPGPVLICELNDG